MSSTRVVSSRRLFFLAGMLLPPLPSIACTPLKDDVAAGSDAAPSDATTDAGQDARDAADAADPSDAPDASDASDAQMDADAGRPASGTIDTSFGDQGWLVGRYPD